MQGAGQPRGGCDEAGGHAAVCPRSEGDRVRASVVSATPCLVVQDTGVEFNILKQVMILARFCTVV